MTTPVQQVVQAYRAEYGSDKVPDCFEPEGGLDTIIKLITIWHDTPPDNWEHKFAIDMLAAMLPDTIAPEGTIGQDVLQGKAGR